MSILYWVKWEAVLGGFEEMADMFRYSGDMPRKAFYKSPKEKYSLGMYYVEMESVSPLNFLNNTIFERWASFGAWIKNIDHINTSKEMKAYRYDPKKTKELFEKLIKENKMGMYADW